MDAPNQNMTVPWMQYCDFESFPESVRTYI